MELKPIFNSTLLITAVVYGVLRWIGWPHGLAGALMGIGLFGFLLGFMITLSLFRFAYHALREVALGRKYITPPDLESTNPVGETSFALHATLYTLLPVMFLLMPDIIGEGPTAEWIRALGLLVVVGTFPASIAVMAMTHNPAAALSPVSIGAVIRVMRLDYVLLLGWCAAIIGISTLASALLGGGIGIIDNIIEVWGFLALFALVGSAIRAHRAAFDYSDVDEVRAQHAEDDRRRAWHSAVDRAYVSIRSGFVDQGYTTIKQLIAAEHDSLDVYQWVFNRMLDWQERKFALDLARRFLTRLVEEKRDTAALDLIQQCRHLSPAFEVPPEIAAKLSAYARTVGRPKLAEELASAAAAAAASSAATAAPAPAVSPRPPTL